MFLLVELTVTPPVDLIIPTMQSTANSTGEDEDAAPGPGSVSAGQSITFSPTVSRVMFDGEASSDGSGYHTHEVRYFGGEHFSFGDSLIIYVFLPFDAFFSGKSVSRLSQTLGNSTPPILSGMSLVGRLCWVPAVNRRL